MSRRAGVRLSGGRWRGRILDVAAGVRPTESRVREALASIWAGELAGARVLELFAGSGAVGLELLGRGAASATFVELRRSVASVLEKNLQLAEPSSVRLLAMSADAALARLTEEGACFDLVFADPPYADEVDSGSMKAMAKLSAAGCRLAVERAAGAAGPPATPEGRLVSTRRYGDSELALFDRAPTASGPAIER